MRIRILDGADNRFTQTIEFPDLPTELLDLHHRLGRVARGTREVPATIVTLTRPPTSGTVENLPCQLALLPDATHPALNAKVVFRGLRAHLDARYGLSRMKPQKPVGEPRSPFAFSSGGSAPFIRHLRMRRGPRMKRQMIHHVSVSCDRSWLAEDNERFAIRSVRGTATGA